MIAKPLPRARSHRAAFTLIELLGVIAIIAILLAMSAGAYFRVRVSQQESATNTTLQKLHSELQTQWDAGIDIAKEDARTNRIPATVMSFAGNDSRRALVVWTKIRLKLEFPQNFDEAVNFPQNLNSQAGIYVSPKSSYKQEITVPFAANNINPIPAGSLTADQAHRESAALLYLSLTQGRRGMQAFDPVNHLGAHAVSTVTLTQYTYMNGTNPTYKCFVDTWGQPIAFIRWATGADTTRDVNQPPYWTTNTIAGVLTRVDPQDPEKTLYDASWANSQNWTTFTNVIHPLSANGPFNLSPFVFSGGRDNSDGKGNNWGVKPDFSYTGVGEDDNLYSYRLRGVGRK